MAETKRQEVEAATRVERQAVEEAKKTFALIEETKATEAMKMALDITGIADPWPTSDGASALLSLSTGDYWGAALSGVSMVPYLGDAFAKPAKILKATGKAKKLLELAAGAAKKIARAQKAIDQKKIAISKRVAEKIRNKRVKKLADGTCNYGTRLPATGKWSGAKGNSMWTSDAGHVVHYENGYPNFEKAFTADGRSVVYPDSKVELPDMMGNDVDFKAANAAMREKFPDWNGPPENYTWHHVEDGSTMILVETNAHHAAMGAAGTGSAHTGGASIARDLEF